MKTSLSDGLGHYRCRFRQLLHGLTTAVERWHLCRFNRLESLRWRLALLHHNWAAATKHRYWLRFKRLEQHHWRLDDPRLLLGGTLCLILASYLYPVVATPWIWPEYQYRHHKFSGTAVYDSTGRFLGGLPGQLDPLADYSLGEILRPDHKALVPKAIPNGWWDVLRSLEDRHLGTWRSWGGIDVLALMQALWDIPTGKVRGASSLTMQLVRSLRHDNPESSDPLLQKLRRKWVELRDAPVLMYNLGGEGMASLKQSLALHVPLAIGCRSSPFGESLYGIEVTAWIVFGRPAHELNLGQQAILAAAFYRPIVLAAESDAKGTELRDKRWALLKARAARGLRLAYGEGDSRTREGLTQLAELPPPRSSVPDDLMPLLPTDPLERFQVSTNPVRRSLTFAFGEMRQAVAELQEAYGWHWRERVRAVELTVDVAANAVFKRRIERALTQLQRFLEPRLDLNLIPNGNGPTAQVIVALAGPNGELLQYYANTDDTVYAGVQSLRDRGGRYRPERETRPIGSLGKVPVAVLLGSLGDPFDRWHYCNRRQGGILNANGDAGLASCRQAGALYKAVEIFGPSQNLALVGRLSHLPEAQLQALADAFGLTVPPGAGPLRLALPLGTVTAAPRTVQQMMLGVLLGVAGQPLAVQVPRILRKVWVLRTDGRTTVESPATSSLSPSIQHYLTDDHARRYVRETLSAPLKARFGGTLSDLEDWVAGKKSGLAIHLAKTGTTTVGDSVRDKWAVGGLLWRERAYTYLALVGTGDPRKPLGHSLSGNAVLAPLIRIVLEETQRTQP